MFDLNKKFMDRFFRAVDDVVWDMMSGRVGYQTKDGICSIDLGTISEDKKEAPEAQISINPFENFGMAVPAFAQSVPVTTISLGDMIFSSGKVLGWIVKINEKSFKLLKQDGTRSDWSPPKVQMLGFDSGVMVLRSLLNMLPGGSGQLGQMQSMLMPMMAMGMLGEGEDGDSMMDMKSMMPMILMSQMGLGGSDAGASTGMMGNMMQMMMMSQMMKSMKGGGKPFFGK